MPYLRSNILEFVRWFLAVAFFFNAKEDSNRLPGMSTTNETNHDLFTRVEHVST